MRHKSNTMETIQGRFYTKNEKRNVNHRVFVEQDHVAWQLVARALLSFNIASTIVPYNEDIRNLAKVGDFKAESTGEARVCGVPYVSLYVCSGTLNGNLEWRMVEVIEPRMHRCAPAAWDLCWYVYENDVRECCHVRRAVILDKYDFIVRKDDPDIPRVKYPPKREYMPFSPSLFHPFQLPHVAHGEPVPCDDMVK